MKIIKAVADGQLESSMGSRLVYMINVSAGITKDDRILNEFAGRIDLIESVKL